MANHEPLTTEQLLERKKLIERFRIAVYEAIWVEIENTDPVLLSANDGTPYSELRTTAKRNELEAMADNAASAAAGRMNAWL